MIEERLNFLEVKHKSQVMNVSKFKSIEENPISSKKDLKDSNRSERLRPLYKMRNNNISKSISDVRVFLHASVKEPLNKLLISGTTSSEIKKLHNSFSAQKKLLEEMSTKNCISEIIIPKEELLRKERRRQAFNASKPKFKYDKTSDKRIDLIAQLSGKLSSSSPKKKTPFFFLLVGKGVFRIYSKEE